ncbi:MAG: MFS transporter [Deltaproteobacteria bacterium]|nr:MFS transporter [Deltaproteobacteria bacterium]
MRRLPFYYGYLIAAACFSIQAIGIGTYVSFGIFFKYLIAEFGWSRALLSGAHSLTLFVTGSLGIFVGRLNDRYGPRIVMAVTGFLFGLGLMLMSMLREAWHLYLFYGLIVGMGMSSVDVIALSTTARWFVRKRGLMTGIVKVGTGTGQLLVPIIASMLIVTYGWRKSYIVMGLAGMFLLMGVGQLLRRDPVLMGVLPDGDTKAEARGILSEEMGMGLKETVRTRSFWTICLTNLVVVSSLMVVMLHIVPHATDMGVPVMVAAGILSTIGGVSMVGRFVTGISIDFLGNRRSMIICFLLLISALLWLQVARELWMLYLFAAAYGLAHGGFFTVISPIVAEYFGVKSHGVLFGIAVFSGTIGGALGPILAGHIFDVTKSYSLAFWIITALAAIGLGLILSLGKPARP